MAILSQVSKSSPANMRSTIPAGACLWTGALVTVVVLGLLAMGSAQAIDIPTLPVVPPNIAATNPVLVQQRDKLLDQRKALLDKTNSHNSMCNAVEAGSAADSICTRAYAPLEAEIKSHVQVSKQYNTRLLAAVNLAASQKSAPPPPHTDTSVVDARNVPSGLPKSLDNAIAKAYSNSPPGVSDRVRKGFQAVMVRDWKVAKAWFQDALKRDPNNAGLKRMIVLTDYSLRDRQAVTSGGTGSVPAVKTLAPTKAEIDEFFRNFREGRKFTPTDKVRNHVASMSNEEFKNRIWESPLQLPQDSDIDYLFDLK
ncbi:MAG: hypothetical protein NUV55_03025 [Sulfuricaulis sp.]|uniref:hypothetical protein n=1 Tax=Sulfuricaulis sp. TaxID=2003553 RepID=UPI0025E71C86|nr:hypothetical protein [Sulfuricaulis sp.]MCR4346168.1 hypothetical protein [Sulfuricaulis sp.]